MDKKAISEKMNLFIAARKFDEMIDYADVLIQENPKSYLGKWWKGRTLTFIGNTDYGLHWFIEAMKVAVDDMEESKIASSMANVYNVRKQWDESLNYTSIALELNPKNVVGVIARSIALMTTGRKKEALKLLDANKNLYVEDCQKACVAAIKKEKSKMLEYLKKTVAENPHSKVTVQYDPDFSMYRFDKEFRAIIS